MKRYKAIVNGVVEIFDVGPNRYDDFIKDHPDAVLVEETKEETKDFSTDTAADAEVVSEKVTLDTDSASENGSSESTNPLNKYLLTIEDISLDEETVSPALNKKLARIGITVDEGTSFNSLDAINLSSINNGNVNTGAMGGLSALAKEFIGDPSKILSGIGVGPNKTKEELQKAVNKINNYILTKGDLSFENKAAERSQAVYDEYAEIIVPPSLSNEEVNIKMKEELISEFNNIESSDYRDKVLPMFRLKNDKEKLALYEEWKKTGTISDFSKEEIEKGAIKIDEDYISNESTKFVSDLDPSQRTDVLALASRDLEKIQNYQEEVNNFNIQATNLENEIKEYNENPTEGVLLALKNKEANLQREQNNLQKIQKDSKSLFDKGKAVPLALQDFNKNYNRLNQLRSNFKNMGASFAYTMAQLAEMSDVGGQALFSASPAIFNMQLEDKYGVVSLGASMEKEISNFQKDIKVNEITSIKDAGRWVAGSTTQLIPSLSLAFTGPAAMPLFFASGFGGKGMEIALNQDKAAKRAINNRNLLEENPEMNAIDKALIKGQMDEDAKTLGISSVRIMAAQVIEGAAEVVFEKLGTMRLLKGIKEGIKMLPPQTIIQGATFAAKKFIGGSLIEGSTEWFTTLAQNFNSIYVLDKDQNLFGEGGISANILSGFNIADEIKEGIAEGSLESFAQGALMGGAMGGSAVSQGIKQAIVSSIGTKQEIAELTNITKALRELTGENKIQGPADPILKSLKLEGPVQEMVDALIRKGEALNNGVLFKLGSNMSLDNAQSVEEINKKLRKLSKNLRTVSLSGIGANALTKFKNETQKEFDDLIEQREKLIIGVDGGEVTAKSINNYNLSLDASQGWDAYNSAMLNQSEAYVSASYFKQSELSKLQGEEQAKADLIKETGKTPTADEIAIKAHETFVDNIYAARIDKGKKFAVVFAKDQGLDLDIQTFEGADRNAKILQAAKDANASEETLINLKKQLETEGNFEGVQIGNTILIDKTNSIKNRRIGIYAHEVLHAYASSQFSKSTSEETSAAINVAGKSLLDYLQKNDPDLYAKVKYRIDSSYTNKEGDKLNAYYEEAMNAMSDIMADGQQLKPNSLNKLRLFVNKLMPKQFALKNGQETYEWVKGFNKAAHFGNKTNIKAITVKSSGDDNRVNFSISVNKLEEELEQLNESLESGEMQFEEFEGKEKILENKIAKAKISEKGETNKTVKPKKKKEQTVSQKEQNAKVNALVGEKDAEGNYISTKKEWLKDGVGRAYNAIVKGNLIDGLIVKGIVGDTIQGKSVGEFVQDVKESLTPLLMRFNPEINNSLIGFINSQLFFRKGDALIKLRKGKTENIDSGTREMNAIEAKADKSFNEIKQEPIGNLLKATSLISQDTRSKLAEGLKKWAKDNNIDFDNFRFSMVDTTLAITDELGNPMFQDLKGKQVINSLLDDAMREIFPNVSPDKILDTRKMFTGKEATAMHKAFLADVVDADSVINSNDTDSLAGIFIKILPKGAIAADGKNKTTAKDINTNRATALDPSILQNFYVKSGKAIGKTGLQEYVLKDNIRYSDVYAAFGMDSAGNKTTYNRSGNTRSVLAASGRLLGQLMMNEVIRTDLGLTAEQQLNTAAGKSDAMFSFSKEVSEIFGVKPLAITNQKEADAFVENMKKVSILLNNVADEDGKVYNMITKAVLVKRTSDLKREGTSKDDAKELSIYIKKKIAKLKGKNGTVVARNTVGRTKPGGIFKTYNMIVDEMFSGNKLDAYNKKHEKISVLMWTEIYKAIKKNPEMAESIAYFIALSISERTHPAAMASFKGFEKISQEMLKTPEGKIKLEHAFPVDANNLYLFKLIKDNIDNKGTIDEFTKDLKASQKQYGIIALSTESADKVDKAGYRSTMPPGSTKDWQRYLNPKVASISGGIDPFNVFVRQGEKIITLSEYAGWRFSNGKKMTDKQIKEKKEELKNINKQELKLSISNNNQLPKNIRFNKPALNEQVIREMEAFDKAVENANNLDMPEKGISVWDFDDTLAKTKSNILYTMPDGSTGKLTAEQFAKEGDTMAIQGAVYDFNEFSKVVKGSKGPFFEKAMARNKKFGNENVYILTARPANSAPAIHEFLKGIGLNIPLENITGLADSSPQAKARWVVNKAAEGYNDFYFADDHIGNVKAVKEALSVLDVKSKVQQARFSTTKQLDDAFNKYLEGSTGIEAYKRYKKDKAMLKGKGKGRFDYLIPPGAEDFVGLLYKTLQKGKKGEQQFAFYKKYLIDPYMKAMSGLIKARTAIGKDFIALKKELGIIPKSLKKTFKVKDENGKMKDSLFTVEQAIRTYVWNAQGIEMPNLSQVDLALLINHINANPKLKLFADKILSFNKGVDSKPPSIGWLAGSIATDLQANLNSVGRKQLLEVWTQNKDAIFSEENLNKLEAAYGADYVDAVKDVLRRMTTGRSTLPASGNKDWDKIVKWLNAAVGNIMSFNIRSASLQLLSITNFIDMEDNNIITAGKAFANQKQYWKDVVMLLNSDYLVDRRDGTRINVNEADIALAAKEGGAQGVLNKILEVGFLPTKIADSFAIAVGGSTYYRTKVNALIKKGMNKTAAEKQAMLDFMSRSEESQQSSEQSKISRQQAGSVGKLILAFGNTSAQYARIIKKSALDLKNGRGNPATHIARITYYGAIQNFVFNYLQQALFKLSFGDEEEEEESDAKKVKMANSMVDSLLRGMGWQAAALAAIKNTAFKLYERNDKKVNNDFGDKAVATLLTISPPLSSKISKIARVGNIYEWEMKKKKRSMFDDPFSLDSPQLAMGATLIAAATSLPTDRALSKAINIVDVFKEDTENWQRPWIAAGWPKWSLQTDAQNAEDRKKKSKTKVSPRQARKQELMDKGGKAIRNMLRTYGFTELEIQNMKVEANEIEAIIKFQDEVIKK